MPRITFHRLMPVEIDVPLRCPKCGADFTGPILDRRGQPVTERTQYDTSGMMGEGGRGGPLSGLVWDASSFTGSLTGKDDAGDWNRGLDTNSLSFFSLDDNGLMHLACAAQGCNWFIDVDKPKTWPSQALLFFWLAQVQLATKELTRLPTSARMQFWMEVNRLAQKLLVHYDGRLARGDD